MHLLPDRLPWFVAGPCLGLLVVGLYAVANKPLGATGAYVQVINLARDRITLETWRIWYFVGLIVGAAIAVALGSGFTLTASYGVLGEALPIVVLIPLLAGAGVLLGYGARWMGGCTSGHGLCGVSTLSMGSVVATASFFATAVAVTLLVHQATGGAV
ncbi:MAG: YeeE/YedE family protein [Ktedonobacterales bacterium]